MSTNAPGHSFNPGEPPATPPPTYPLEEDPNWKEYAAREYIETGAIVDIHPPTPAKPSAPPLPPALERRLLAAAIFRLLGSDMFAANIAALEQQISEQPFAVLTMTTRLRALAEEAT